MTYVFTIITFSDLVSSPIFLRMDAIMSVTWANIEWNRSEYRLHNLYGYPVKY